jgi:integrase
MTKPKRRTLPKYVTEEVDKRGTTYIYFRRKGQPKVRMHGVPWTEPFMAEYRILLEGGELPSADGEIKLASKGTLRKLCEDYFSCAAFTRLDKRTQTVRRRLIEHCLDEPVHKDRPSGKVFADKPIKAISGKDIRILRDRKSDLPEAANGRVKALRQVFAFAVDDEQIDKNPARDIPYLKSGSEGFHSWTEAEVQKFEERWPIGTKPRLALALLLYTGQRRSDIVLFGRQHVTNGWLHFTQAKNRRNNPITLEIPIRPELRRIIDASPTGDLTFLVTEHGKGFTPNGFGNWFRRQCDQAELPQCSAHGLRKAAARRLAEAGATEHEIMAITGHRTSKEVARYTRASRQKILAERAFNLKEAD